MAALYPCVHQGSWQIACDTSPKPTFARAINPEVGT